MATKQDERDQAGVRLKWLAEYFTVLEGYLSLPEPDFPDFRFGDDPTTIGRGDVEEAAEKLRLHWGLGDGPIPNVVRVLERKGAIVGSIKLGIEKLDGLSLWSSERCRPVILLNTDKASCVRSRFDAAHELAHMILHRHVTEGERGSKVFKLMEQQAHDFAAAFLLPRTSWFRETRRYTLGEFKALKLKWRVSIAAQVMRAAVLDEDAAARKTSLMKQLSAKRWRTHEPYDDMWPIESPRLFEQATRMMAEHGFGVSSIIQEYPRRVEHLSEVTGLSPEFFETDALPLQLDTSSLN